MNKFRELAVYLKNIETSTSKKTKLVGNWKYQVFCAVHSTVHSSMGS